MTEDQDIERVLVLSRVVPIDKFSNSDPLPPIRAGTARSLAPRRSDLQKQLAQPTEPAPRQVRITRTQLEQAARDYESGMTLKEIAAGLGITRSPLRRKLAAMGVAIRYQGLDAAGEQEAVRLYRSGLSLVAVGDRLGVDHGTIHNTLRRLGEPTRDSHGQVR